MKDGTEPIDAVVLDYRLPDSNDLTLLATIRGLSPDSAVVLMTAFGTPEITKGAFELGVYDVLHKPFELTELAPLLPMSMRPRLTLGTIASRAKPIGTGLLRRQLAGM